MKTVNSYRLINTRDIGFQDARVCFFRDLVYLMFSDSSLDGWYDPAVDVIFNGKIKVTENSFVKEKLKNGQ